MNRLKFILPLLLITGCGGDEERAQVVLAGEPCPEPTDAGGDAAVSAPPGPDVPPKEDAAIAAEAPDASAAPVDGG